MKRFSLLIITCLLGLLSLSVASAYDASVDGLHRLADLMPDDIELFMAAEISEDVFAEFDTFVGSITDHIPLTYPPETRAQLQNLSLNQIVTEQMLSFNFPWYDLYPVIGQYMGIGGSYKGDFLDTDDMEIWIVLDILDQQRMHEILLDISIIDTGRLLSTGEIISYEIEDVGILAITKTHLLMTTASSDMFDIQPLSKNSEFIASLNSLQEDSYDIIMYLSKVFMQDVIAASAEDSSTDDFDFDATFGGLEEVILGFALKDGQTALIDISWRTDTPAIAPTFSHEVLKSLPASTDFMVAAADFNILYDSLTSFIRDSAELQGDSDPIPMLNLVLNYGKLDFEDDFLSWATGTYVVFMGNDFETFVEEAYSPRGQTNLDDLMFGIAVEATNPDKVVEFVETIGDVLGVLVNATDEVTIKNITLDNKPALNILFSFADGTFDSPTLDQFILVPMDQFLYFGTVNGYEEIASGNTLQNNSDFELALNNTLDTPNSIIYLNSELSVLVTTLIVMTADEPYYDLIRDIQGSRYNNDGLPTVETYYAAFDWLNRAFSNITFTSEVNEEGIVQIRMSMGLR